MAARTAFLFAGAAFLFVTSPARALTRVPVLIGSADQEHPVAGSDSLVWSEAPSVRSTRFSVYVRLDGQPRFRVNAAGTVGFSGSGTIEGARIAYQQRRRYSGPGDIKLYDLATRKRSEPPSGVNTGLNERVPSLSGDWLLFGRSPLFAPPWRVLLFNLRTHELRTLTRPRRAFTQPGSVSGYYATWYRCERLTRCAIYLYDISTRARVRVPNPLRRAPFGVAVTSAGVVYFAESKNVDCGRGLALWRWRPGDTRTKLLSLPAGRDTSGMSPLPNADGSTTVLYDRYRCRPDTAAFSEGDIFRFVTPPDPGGGVTQVTTVAPASGPVRSGR